MKAHVANPNSNPYRFPAHLFRIGFGLLFIFVGIKKFRMGLTGFADSLVTADTLMANEVPNALIYAYGIVLPFAELGAGILLVINRYTYFAYQAIAVMYLSFILGQMYNGNTSKVGTEYLPSMIALAAAYYFDYEYHKIKN